MKQLVGVYGVFILGVVLGQLHLDVELLVQPPVPAVEVAKSRQLMPVPVAAAVCASERPSCWAGRRQV
ncbi:hypothetical protein [Chitinimonas naiadis]